MKTSNKILAGLIVVVFSIPFLLALSLKSKMKNGEYTIVKHERSSSEGIMQSGSFTAFKVVKVVAPNPRFLKCHLKLSDKMDYTYFQQKREDSMVVFTSNDTLFIKFSTAPAKDQNDRRNYNQTSINVNLSSFNNLVVDGAEVIIDSFPNSLGTISVSLKNQGVLKDGSKKEQEGTISREPGMTKDNGLHQSSSLSAEVTNDQDRDKIIRLENVSLTVSDLNIRDILLFRVLYRI